MKGNFLRACYCAASIIGGVIGAGFITGAEIVRFFPSNSFVPCCYMLCVLMFLFLFSMMAAGSNDGVNAVNLRVLGRFSCVYKPVTFMVSFVSVASMCAGIDSLFSVFTGISEYVPIASSVLMLISLCVCSKGIYGVGVFNLTLVPVMLACIFSLPLGVSDYSISQAPVRFESIVDIFLYLGLNCFSSAPLLFEQGEKFGKKVCLCGAIVAALAISLSVLAVCVKIDADGGGGTMPIMSTLIKNRVFYVVFGVITAFGIVTTLVCSHFTLIDFVKESPLKRVLNAIIVIAVIVFSRFGFGVIIDRIYPVVGFMGLIYCIAVTVNAQRRLFCFSGYKFFGKANEGVHSRSKSAKYQSRSVNQI